MDSHENVFSMYGKGVIIRLCALFENNGLPRRWCSRKRIIDSARNTHKEKAKKKARTLFYLLKIRS